VVGAGSLPHNLGNLAGLFPYKKPSVE
jgi:hypothetical protein